MPHARARFFALAGFLLTMFGVGEGLARRSEPAMLAIAHRVNFKLALLEARGGADFVVLGSSRGNDCVAPRAMGSNGASLATPSSSLPTLEHLAARAAATQGLKVALVELSRRQVEDETGDVESAVLDVDADADPVGAFVTRHSALLRGRRAFAVENWSRLPALVVPSAFDGSEFFHSRWLSEAFASAGEPGPGELDRLIASRDVPAEQSGPEWERVSTGYRRVLDSLRARGIKVVLYGPPLAARRRAEECDEQSRRFRASVAAFVGAPFFDFACSEVPDAWLTDGDEHCGTVGRARFSVKLREVMAHAVP